MKVHFSDPYTPLSGVIEASTWGEFLEKLTRAQADAPNHCGSKVYDDNPKVSGFSYGRSLCPE